jgi:high-affinity Fe2+/Pb2+ permease
MITSRLKRDDSRPAWLPPVLSIGLLFALFLAAMVTRRLGLGDAGRITMISLSTIAGAGITLYGGKMLNDARERGWPAAIAGLVMGFLGIYTILHVLR